MKIRWVVIAGFAIFCGGLLFLFSQAFGKDPHLVPFKMLGKPAPAFVLTDLNSGKRVSLDDFKGKAIYINFWATWCGPCKQEHPVIQWGFEQFGDKITYLGVVYEDTDDNAKAFLRINPTGYPQMLDANGSMAVDYGVTGVPESYFIDRDGIIRGKWANPIDPQRLQDCITEVSAPSADHSPLKCLGDTVAAQ